MSIQQELREWAEETANVYNPIAERIKLGYYTQSVLSRIERTDQLPKIAILGINPGAEGGAIKQSGQELLNGNPCFKGKSDEEILFDLHKRYDIQKRRYGWDIIRKMYKILESSGKEKLLENLDDFLLANMIFFGTAKQYQIPKGLERKKCVEQTLRLINILKPKVVVLLGKECRNLFNNVSGTKMVAITPDNAVFYCFYNSCHVISMYHTAYYRYYTHENMEKVGKIIGKALDNPSVQLDKF